MNFFKQKMSRSSSFRSESRHKLAIANQPQQREQAMVVFKKSRKKDNSFELLHNFVQKRKIKKTRNYIILAFTLILFSLSYAGVIVIQYGNFQDVLASNNEDLEQNAKFCQVFSFGNFDIVR